MSLCIISANTTSGTLYIRLSCTNMYFGCFLPSPGRFYSNMLGKEYCGGDLPFTVNVLKYITFYTMGIIKYAVVGQTD